MRQARLKASDDHETAYYHVISRVVKREFVLGEEEREQFVEMMRCYEHFCGVRVITYCVLSNHFHLLLAVPRRPETLPDDRELPARAKALFSPQELGTLRWRLEHWHKTGAGAEADAPRAKVCRRMWDLGFYVKGLKQCFGGWLNRRVGRRGTLWEERFKERADRGRRGAGYHRRLHRPEPGARGPRARPQGLTLERLRSATRRRAEGTEWPA